MPDRFFFILTDFAICIKIIIHLLEKIVNQYFGNNIHKTIKLVFQKIGVEKSLLTGCIILSAGFLL